VTAYSGAFVLNAVSMPVKRGVIAWLTDRSGRQVRVGIGPVGRRPTAEARTGEEVERLLAKAEEYIEVLREISTKDRESETTPESSGDKIEALEINLRLFPGPDDKTLGDDPAYQNELEQFEQSLSSQGLEVSRLIELRESAEAAPTLSSFVIALAPTVGTVLSAAVGAWLHARYGRKVRLKIGEVEAEAQTVAEVETLLKRAAEFQQGNQSKLINEP